MSHLRRAPRRLAAVAAVLLASFCAGPLVLPHVDAISDPDWLPQVIVHDESAHRVGSEPPRDIAHEQHCLLCHWIRAFSSLSPTGEQTADRPTRAERLADTSALVARGAADSLALGRAPPA
jgi:hypothetical protein